MILNPQGFQLSCLSHSGGSITSCLKCVWGGSSAPGCRDHRDRGGEGRDKGRGGEEKKGEGKGGRASSVYLDPCKGTSVKVSDLQPPPNWGTHRVESEQITHAYCFV